MLSKRRQDKNKDSGTSSVGWQPKLGAALLPGSNSTIKLYDSVQGNQKKILLELLRLYCRVYTARTQQGSNRIKATHFDCVCLHHQLASVSVSEILSQSSTDLRDEQ